MLEFERDKRCRICIFQYQLVKLLISSKTGENYFGEMTGEIKNINYLSNRCQILEPAVVPTLFWRSRLPPTTFLRSHVTDWSPRHHNERVLRIVVGHSPLYLSARLWRVCLQAWAEYTATRACACVCVWEKVCEYRNEFVSSPRKTSEDCCGFAVECCIFAWCSLHRKSFTLNFSAQISIASRKKNKYFQHKSINE